MWRSLFLVFFLIAGVTSEALASLWDQKTPVQNFQQAGSSAESGTQNTEKPVLTAKAAAEQQAGDDSAQNKPTKPAQPEKADLLLLQNQINQLNQNQVLFSESVNNKYGQQEEMLTGLQKQIQQLKQALLLLNEEVSQLARKSHQSEPQVQQANSENSISSWGRQTLKQLGIPGFILILVSFFFVIGLLFARRFFRRPPPQNQKVAEAAHDDTRDEYDYMGSEESIPAKLNLARAYIAMEDFASAKKVIAEILQHGNPDQHQEATLLMQEITKQS